MAERALGLLCVFVFSALLVAACSDPETANNGGTDSGNVNEDSGGNPDSPGALCSDKTNAVRDSISVLARECGSASECALVERAGSCACSGSFHAANDFTDFETKLAEADADGCAHPLRCFNSADRCAYASVFENPELIPTCDEGQCGIAEVLSCDEYVQKSTGGVLPPMACADDSQCTLRNDLNPCGCFEAANTMFPFLIADEVTKMIDRNLTRCSLACGACPPASNAVCRNDVCVVE